MNGAHEDASADRSEYIEFADAIFAITRGGDVRRTDEYIQAVDEVYDTDGMTFAQKAALGQRLYGHPEVAARLKSLRTRADRSTEIPQSLSEQSSEAPVLEVDDCSTGGTLRSLAIIRDEARREGDFRAAVAAEVKRGELRRLYAKGQQDPADEAGEDLSKMTPQEIYAFAGRNANLTLRLIAAVAPPGTSTKQ